MARFSYQDADNYGNSGSSNFFQLQKDGEKARVRFMYRTADDIEGVSVHEVQIGGKKRYVNCIREYNDPIDKCPFCQANSKIIAKVFVPLYNVDTGEVLVWERGKKFFPQLTELCSRTPNLVSQVFEITRHGDKNDTNTTYSPWPLGSPDNTRLEDLPEPVDIYAKGIVLNKTPEDMDYYSRYHEFPDRPQQAAPQQDSQQYTRRTPSRGDVFN